MHSKNRWRLWALSIMCGSVVGLGAPPALAAGQPNPNDVLIGTGFNWARLFGYGEFDKYGGTFSVEMNPYGGRDVDIDAYQIAGPVPAACGGGVTDYIYADEETDPNFHDSVDAVDDRWASLDVSGSAWSDSCSQTVTFWFSARLTATSAEHVDPEDGGTCFAALGAGNCGARYRTGTSGQVAFHWVVIEPGGYTSTVPASWTTGRIRIGKEWVIH